MAPRQTMLGKSSLRLEDQNCQWMKEFNEVLTFLFTVKGDDGEMVECEIISAVEKESSFQKSVPILNTKLAALFAFLNLFPGKWRQISIQKLTFVYLRLGKYSNQSHLTMWQEVYLQFTFERLLCWCYHWTVADVALSCGHWLVLECLVGFVQQLQSLSLLFEGMEYTL